PADKAARAGYGPEWSIGMLQQLRAVLRRHAVSKPIWDTEVNVGRAQFRRTSRTFPGLSGAAMVARTYLLHLDNGVERAYWYAADDRSWAGTWLEEADFRSLTPAGVAYRTL